MFFINNWSISAKILAIPVIGTLGFLINLVITSSSTLNSAELLSVVKKVDYPLLQLSEETLYGVKGVNEKLSNAVTTGEEEMLAEAEKQAKAIMQSLSSISSFDGNLVSSQRTLTAKFDTWFNQASSLSAGLVSGEIDFSTLPARSSEMAKSFDAVTQELGLSIDSRQKNFNHAIDSANENANSNLWVGVVTGGAMTILLFVVAVPISRKITRNLADVIGSLRNIAEDNGDLTVRLPVNSKDEIGELVKTFNSFMDKLQGLMRQLVDAALPLPDMAAEVKTLSDTSLNSGKQLQHNASESQSAVDRWGYDPRQ